MKAPVTLHVTIDLGSDTLKLAYAYIDPVSGVSCGKLATVGPPTQIGIPAVAMYSKSGKWLFGNQVEESGEQDFTTVVHIKSLISLLAKQQSERVWKSNCRYYSEKRVFPKFYLPGERTGYDDFSRMEADEHTFTADKTPREVCELFFLYVASLTGLAIPELEKSREITVKETTYSVIYPSKVGDEYINELSRLVESAFRTRVYKSLSSVKALGIYAYQNGKITGSEPFLVFDIGEDFISVAKAWFIGGNMIVDGQDGHKYPEELGGSKLDETICRYLELMINDRETIGTPSAGDPRHKSEGCLDSKKYQLLKDIKCAKHILSRNNSEQVYASGVHLLICRDCFVQRTFTRSELISCIGVGAGQDTPVGRIAAYVRDEVVDPINSDITKVLISGGAVETAGVADYLRSVISSVKRGVGVYTFDFGADRRSGESSFSIFEEESCVYSAALGGAIVAARDIKIKTVLSLSYGTWVNSDPAYGREHKLLSLFVDRGETLNEKTPKKFGETYSSTFRYEMDRLSNDEVISTVLTRSDMKVKKYEGHSVANGNAAATVKYSRAKNDSTSWYLLIDEIGSNQRRALGGKFKVNTEISSDMHFYYGGRRVCLVNVAGESTKIRYSEGISVSPDGRARIYVDNVSEPEHIVGIKYRNSAGTAWLTQVHNVRLCDIKIGHEKSEFETKNSKD